MTAPIERQPDDDIACDQLARPLFTALGVAFAFGFVFCVLLVFGVVLFKVVAP